MGDLSPETTVRPDVRRPVRSAVIALALLAAGCQKDHPRELLSRTDVPICQRCHGGGGSSAPPTALSGETATTARGVGAHRAHLDGSAIRGPIRCGECHVVPDVPEGHYGDGVTVTFGGSFTAGDVARARGATPAWDPDTLTCSGTYCHGATLTAGGQHRTPKWTLVDGTQATCQSCHLSPPVGRAPHDASMTLASCVACHPQTVDASGNILVAGGKHIDGTVQASGGCNVCHGAPPTTGAHRAHVSPASLDQVSYGDTRILEDVATGGTSYFFGCGNCHPLDGGKHNDGHVDVDLSPLGAPAGSLKALNDPAAAWAAGTQTCSGAYCHSGGQAAPVFRASPPWNAPAGTLGCNGCHDDPPRYANGGPGAATANSHLGLASNTAAQPQYALGGWESGHFAGLPGPSHQGGPKHGADGRLGPNPAYGNDDFQVAAPITCQTCHAATVDPANVSAVGGFFWIDTTGEYSLLPDGANPLRGTSTAPGNPLTNPSIKPYDVWKFTQCGICHDDVVAPRKAGRVLPLRHVNGKRDVVFDARTALNPGWELRIPSLATAAPVRPYLVTGWNRGMAAPPASPDIELREQLDPPVAALPPVLTLSLTQAAWDPATKTCSNVACHLAETTATWGTVYRYPEPSTCTRCHPQ